MRKLLAVMLSLVMVSALAFAKPTTQLEFATMSKADSQFLFKDGAKAVALDKTEMKSTEGQGIIGAWLGGAMYLAWHTGWWFGSGSWQGSWGGFGGATGAGFVLTPW